MAIREKAYERKRKLEPYEKLSDKSKEMARQLVSDPRLSPKAAALLAGYSAGWADKSSYGHVLKPAMKTYIEILKNKQIQRTKIDPDYVINTLTRLADKAENEGRYSEATKCVELIGKHYQMFKDISKTEVLHSGKVNPFSSGQSDVAKRADLHRLTKVALSGENAPEPKPELKPKETPDGETIN